MKLDIMLYNYFIEQQKIKEEVKKSEVIASDLVEWMKNTNREVKK